VAVATSVAQMTTRIRHISGNGVLYDGRTKILDVTYTIQLYEQAVLEHSGRARLRISDFSINIGSDPDYDIYPYIGRRVTLRLHDGKQISGAIVSLNGVFLANSSLPDDDFEDVALR
jgi:hypothetical protein